MEVNTTITIDTDDIFQEFEDQIIQTAREVCEENDNGYQTDDDVMCLIDDKVHDYMAEYAEAIELATVYNVRDMITTALDDHETDMNSELIDLRNEVEKARRSIRVLLEEREARLGMRIKRATHNIKGSIGRKVRQIKGRLTRKD